MVILTGHRVRRMNSTRLLFVGIFKILSLYRQTTDFGQTEAYQSTWKAAIPKLTLEKVMENAEKRRDKKCEHFMGTMLLQHMQHNDSSASFVREISVPNMDPALLWTTNHIDKNVHENPTWHHSWYCSRTKNWSCNCFKSFSFSWICQEPRYVDDAWTEYKHFFWTELPQLVKESKNKQLSKRVVTGEGPLSWGWQPYMENWSYRTTKTSDGFYNDWLGICAFSHGTYISN